MRLYLASRWERRSELQDYRSQLIEWGHTVTSRWLTEGRDSEEVNFDSEGPAEFAIQDLEDIDKSSALVAFTEEPDSPHGRGGRHVELGYALALKGGFSRWTGFQVLVVGPRENIFTTLGHVGYYPNPAEFMKFAHGASLVEKHYGREF